jgi:hypothetical protein
MYLISWEEEAKGIEGLLLVEKNKNLNIELLYASPKDTRESNKIILCKKRGPTQINDNECLRG